MRYNLIKASKFIFLFVIIALGACSSITNKMPSHPHNLCEIFKHQSGWEKSAQKSAKKWGVSEPILLSIVYHESSFVADARPGFKKASC